MSTPSSLFCPICKVPYGDTNKRPCLGTCLHNVCNACIKSSGNTKCPTCDKDNAFTYVVYNNGLELTELSEKPLFTASEMFNTIVVKFRREALNFEAVTKPDRFGWILEQFRFTRQEIVDIHSIPELAQAKEKSVEMAREVIDRIEKVLERQLWMKKEELNRLARTNLALEDPEPDGFIDEMFNKFCSHIQQTSPALLSTAAGMAMDHKVFMKEITALSKKFNSIKITNLTKSETAYIDQKVDRKMTEAVQKLGLPEETPQKFFIYKSLCSILKGANDNMDEVREQTLAEIARFEDYFASRMKELENIINKESEEAKLTLRLFLFEVTENSFVVDRLLLKSLEAIHGFCEAQLLWMRYFPETYYDESEEYVYNMLAEKFWNKDQWCYPALELAASELTRIRTGRIRTGYFRSIWELENLRECSGPQCHILYENSASSRNWEFEYGPVLIRKVLIRGSSNAASSNAG